ncbi:MAG: hypothetical protein H6859_05310 [Rhodospirillales bacterium]|nr:MAG: hypothetical protein H6859_05310 [Rhodospirillales bacterium]
MASVVGVVKGTTLAIGAGAVLGPAFLVVAQGGTWAAGAHASASLLGNGVVRAGEIGLATAEAAFG